MHPSYNFILLWLPVWHCRVSMAEWITITTTLKKINSLFYFFFISWICFTQALTWSKTLYIKPVELKMVVWYFNRLGSRLLGFILFLMSQLKTGQHFPPLCSVVDSGSEVLVSSLNHLAIRGVSKKSIHLEKCIPIGFWSLQKSGTKYLWTTVLAF